MEIKQAATKEDIEKCVDVLRVLRPHHEASSMVKIISDMLNQGYKLAFIEENNKAAAAIGYRHLQYLYNGKHIYIDDLVTLEEHRGKGYGSALLNYVEAEAKAHGYKVVALDSGHQRTTAHRLYLNHQYTIAAHHFVKNI
jgi:GNAT superfamily N-acetyltransferase